VVDFLLVHPSEELKQDSETNDENQQGDEQRMLEVVSRFSPQVGPDGSTRENTRGHAEALGLEDMDVLPT